MRDPLGLTGTIAHDDYAPLLTAGTRAVVVRRCVDGHYDFDIAFVSPETGKVEGAAVFEMDLEMDDDVDDRAAGFTPAKHHDPDACTGGNSCNKCLRLANRAMRDKTGSLLKANSALRRELTRATSARRS
jgi:hypothetical protein